MLSQLVTIKNEIDRVLSTPKLSPDDRVKVLNLLHSRFDHIYKVLKYDGLAPLPPPAAGGLQIAAPALHAAAGVPAAGVPAAGVPAPGVPPGLGAMPAAFIPINLLPRQSVPSQLRLTRQMMNLGLSRMPMRMELTQISESSQKESRSRSDQMYPSVKELSVESKPS